MTIIMSALGLVAIFGWYIPFMIPGNHLKSSAQLRAEAPVKREVEQYQIDTDAQVRVELCRLGYEVNIDGLLNWHDFEYITR